MTAKYVADFPLKYIQLISRRDRKILIQQISMHIININTLYKMIWLISSCDYVVWIKIHGNHRLVLLIQAHGKYHMIYRISIKIDIDQNVSIHISHWSNWPIRRPTQEASRAHASKHIYNKYLYNMKHPCRISSVENINLTHTRSFR